jgi:hypothetical protein
MDFNINYRFQPPNSPDLNICDLAVLNSMQKRVDKLNKKSRESFDALIDNVTDVFYTYDAEGVKIIYGHLYANMNESLKHFGCNNYRAPHSQVRQQHNRGEPLDRVTLTIDEIAGVG